MAHPAPPRVVEHHGAGDRHLLSNTSSGIIIAEAGLSFPGFGLPTTVPSWGAVLSRVGHQCMEMAPRLAMWPGVALTVIGNEPPEAPGPPGGKCN